MNLSQQFRWLLLKPRSLAALCFAIAVVIAGILGLASYRNFISAQLNQERSSASLLSLRDASLFLSALKDAESGQRGYLLTRKDAYLQPYNEALPQISRHLSALQRLSGDAELNSLTSRLKEVTDQKLAELASTISLHHNQNQSLALQIVFSDKGKRQMDEIRQLTGKIQQVEGRRLSEAQENAASQLRLFSLSLFGGLLLIAALLGTAGLTLHRESVRRRKAETALTISDAGFRTMAATVPSMLLSARPDGYQTYLSPRWTQFTGMSYERSSGSGWLDAIHPDDRPEVVERWSGSLRTKRNFDMRFRLRRSDGLYHWVLAKIVPAIGSDDEVFQWCGAITDIHQYKALEEKLRSSNDELEHFAYAASHDLQEPLRGITIWAQLLLRSRKPSLDVEEEELFTSIISSAKRMGAMLRGLLEYARLDSVRSDSALIPISMDAALGRALENLSLALSDAQAEVTHEHLPDVRWMEAPAVQIFQNLIGNAVKYRRPEVPPRVHVYCADSADGIMFSVRDNGLGMRSEDVEKSFWIFKRLHQDPTNEGTGLGLAFCKRLVERRGGRIWAESEPGNGSTFSFLVPHIQPSAEETEAQPEAVLAG